MPDAPRTQRSSQSPPQSAPAPATRPAPPAGDDEAARRKSPTGQVLARTDAGAVWAHIATRRVYGSGGNAEQDPDPQDRVEP